MSYRSFNKNNYKKISNRVEYNEVPHYIQQKKSDMNFLFGDNFLVPIISLHIDFNFLLLNKLKLKTKKK